MLVKDQSGNPIAAKVSVVGFETSPDPLNLDSIAGFIDAIGRYFGYDFEREGRRTFGLAKAFFADTERRYRDSESSSRATTTSWFRTGRSMTYLPSRSR